MAAHASVGVAIAVTTISVSISGRVIPGHVNCGLAVGSGLKGGLRTSADVAMYGRRGRSPGKRRHRMLQARADLNDNQKESLQLYGKIERSGSCISENG